MATSHYDFFAAPGTATRGTYHELRIPDEYDADGAPLVFHLGQMEIGERLLAEDMAATLTTLYVTGDESSLERDVLERVADDGQLMAYRHHGFFQPMDTLREKQLLEELWRSGKAPWSAPALAGRKELPARKVAVSA